MKITILSALVLLTAPSLLQAQETRPAGGRGPGGQQGRAPQKSPLFAALDTNADGAIDEAELANAAASIRKLDKNGDGKITEDEVRPAGGGGEREREGGREREREREGGREREREGGREREREGREGEGGRERPHGDQPRANPAGMVATLMAFDKNADGKLSKEEVPERMQGIFERGDKDKNGFLTTDEIKAAVEAQSAPTPAPAKGGPQR